MLKLIGSSACGKQTEGVTINTVVDSWECNESRKCLPLPRTASFWKDAKTDKVLTGRQRGRNLRGWRLSRAEISGRVLAQQENGYVGMLHIVDVAWRPVMQ